MVPRTICKLLHPASTRGGDGGTALSFAAGHPVYSKDVLQLLSGAARLCPPLRLNQQNANAFSSVPSPPFCPLPSLPLPIAKALFRWVHPEHAVTDMLSWLTAITSPFA